ncbi:hypothetical protein PF005_g9051 [Phytophthora fragariae]|uniref:Uncharacterized protein n=1 Tax=Phytophthora fragariae TaxID=53985 RepID=A0A6A3SQ37_9STRA|nr:hypothetical protein PF003_g577 [Phytophthora fragariae]KAE8943518.1 hypothetical protein PF009_g6768 [Phytophthora fragariae]KAE9014494.1 hypothetical protein PF011_g8020 [Phytophthora fragariae]KAE9118544.1 hypothetical protein PF010_g8176 [Phytophthora fragariae]KAE9121208.1 hypothetical protein PF007_g7892 [Phytophthora fragariae]
MPSASALAAAAALRVPAHLIAAQKGRSLLSSSFGTCSNSNSNTLWNGSRLAAH